jgi:AcrR family transcriptional regulator
MSDKANEDVVPGSPAWWIQQSVRSERVGGRGRPPVSFEKIISTALEAVDEVGPQAFNMRMLAERLNSGTATLYRHVASKDEILVHVVDRVLGEVEIDPLRLAKLPWQKACVAGATAFFKMLSAHPKIIPLLVAHIPLGANGLASRERWLSLLVANGFSPELAARAYVTIANYVVGFAIQQHPRDTEVSAHASDLKRFYSALDKSQYPHTVKVAGQLAGISIQQQFVFGLELIIAGLEHLRGEQVSARRA